jgi:antitoxin MazE
MKAVVRKWGNSASVRIPAALLAAAKLSLDDAVDIRAEDGRIIIEPVQDHAWDLDALLGAITDENLHEPTEFGPPQGEEVW